LQKDKTLYPYVMAAFAVILVVSNTIAVKLASFGPFVWTTAILLFPLAYILGDVITEVYGYAGARKIMWVGMAANLLMAAAYALSVAIPGIDPDFDRMYARVLGQVPRLVLASMVGLWAGQFVNAYVMSRMKVWTAGRFLWTRTIASTLFGESVDTAFFAVIGFAGVAPWGVIGRMVYSAAVFKTLYESAITPLTYWVINWFKKMEQLDPFDREINYSPFYLKE
jgi:queuosine precursor transporter